MAATYAFVPSTRLATRAGGLSLRGARILVGHLTATGTYTTGGDTFPTGQTPEDFLKRVGAGTVFAFVVPSACVEWDFTNKKLKIYTGTVPHAEIASGADISTLNLKPCFILGL